MLEENIQAVEEGTSAYSNLVAWEVWNFMSIEHGRVAFDDRNIINIKGYNDSGKSAMLRALDVLFFNIKPNAQVGFIQDGKDYFRIQAHFSDGVVILRDKYLNGQSLYEMYKDGVLLFSTKQGKLLTKVADVPSVIKDYLGVVSCDNVFLNSRSCFDKQLLVQTTGSENYKVLNVLLKSEEIAVASEMLNTDRNRLGSDINVVNAELTAYRGQVYGTSKLHSDVIPTLKSIDKSLDDNDNKQTTLNSYSTLLKNIQDIEISPELNEVGLEELSLLSRVIGVRNELGSIPKVPELTCVDVERLSILGRLISSISELNAYEDIPKLPSVDSSINDLISLCNVRDQLLSVKEDLASIDNEVKVNQETIQSLEDELKSTNSSYVRCKNCGMLIDLNSPHEDEVMSNVL